MLINNKKKCSRCQTSFPTEEFTIHKRNADGRSHYCKSCNAYWGKNYRLNNVEKYKEMQKQSHLKRREERLKNMKDYLSKLKDHIYNLYGNKCDCCGETNREFFAIDHIHGGGTKERKRIGTRGVLTMAYRDGFEKQNYRLLCHNCNMSLGFFGYCPHHPEVKRPILRNINSTPVMKI